MSSPSNRASPPRFPTTHLTSTNLTSAMASTSASHHLRASSNQRSPMNAAQGAGPAPNSAGNTNSNPDFGGGHHGAGKSGKSAVSRSGGHAHFNQGHAQMGGARRRDGNHQQQHNYHAHQNQPHFGQGKGGRGKRGRHGQGQGHFELTSGDGSEVGSLYTPGGKKTSLNHLLNFSYGSHENHFYDNRNNQRYGNNKKGGKGRAFNPHQPKYKKEQYLQANCQFVVHSEATDYSPYLADPDLVVDWAYVEQVGLKTSGDVPSCPICLYPPTAAKIARCGHVYCVSCILHFLALSDYPSRDCPICYVAIYREDLKSVIPLVQSELNTGGVVEMRLMRRERHSLFAVPASEYDKKIDEGHAHFGETNNAHSKLLLATPKQIAEEIIARERKELMDQYAAEKDEPESCFIEEALKMLAERESMLEARGQHKDENKAKEPPMRHLSGGSNSSGEHIKANANGGKDTFYFYQASDGQSLFMNGFNFEMMTKEFGGAEACPDTIKAKILEKESYVMTESLRDKMRYLRHLPVTKNFEVCELDHKSLGLSKETLADFEEQLEERRRKRQRRAKEEKKREKRIMIEEDKLLGKFPGAPKTLRVESEFHFPQMGREQAAIPMSEFVPLGANSEEEDEVGSLNSSFAASPPGGGLDSFANKIRSAPKPVWGKTGSVTRSQSFPVVTAPAIRNLHADSDDELPEGYVPPPPQASLGDSLAQAMASLTTKGQGQGQGQGQSQGQSGKKGKKKFKGTTLRIA